LYLLHRVGSYYRGISVAMALLLGLAMPPFVLSSARAQETTSTTSAEKSSPAQAPNPQSHQATSGGGFYIEFRAAEIGAYGHSYAVYGSAGGRANYADLHPMGSTVWDPDVLKLPVTARYRRTLSAEQYRKLVAAVSATKANRSPYWNAITNNCNHFIGELAQAVGLKVPGQFQVSYAFVPALRDLNGGGSDTTGKKPRERRAATTPRT
jgi:hypothetical protein